MEKQKVAQEFIQMKLLRQVKSLESHLSDISMLSMKLKREFEGYGLTIERNKISGLNLIVKKQADMVADMYRELVDMTQDGE